MPRTFHDALRAYPLFLSPVPPPARLSDTKVEERIASAVRLLESLPRVDAVDVPELVDENHEGRPHYRTVDPRRFSHALAARTGRTAIVNKVVAHLPDAAALSQWANETVALGVRNAVLIGGSSRYIPYPGPPVAEANEIAAPIFGAGGGVLGNIAIPQRKGEAHRMVAKTRAGARFFTTQLVFDADAVGQLVVDYDRLCTAAGIAPAAVLVSVAPVADDADIAFVRWLGADISDAAEQALLEGGAGLPADRSVDRALEVWRAVHDRARRERVAVPLGANVEQVSAHHIDTVGRLAHAFAEAFPTSEATAPAPPPAHAPTHRTSRSAGPTRSAGDT